MSLTSLINSNRLRRHSSSVEELADLLAVVERDLKDASLKGLSPDRRFATAYNAILQLGTMVLRAEGYRTTGTAHHMTTFKALPLIMGRHVQEKADFFDVCRAKRNITEYGRVGEISKSEADELLGEAKAFKEEVLSWMTERSEKEK